MELPNFSNPLFFLALALVMSVIVIIRFFLVAGAFHYLFFRKQVADKWESIKVNPKPYPEGQMKKEMSYSILSSVIFGIIGSIGIVVWQKGYTLVYTDLSAHGYLYLPISLLLSMFIHEVYYYLLHRWMHNPKVFKHLHKVHHDSIVTSVWTAFSFHPLEALLQSLILPVIVLVLPLHPYIILTHLLIMTFFSVLDHLNYELLPKSAHKHPFFKWIIGATHHHYHHTQFKYNYGLYFTVLDKLFGTESPKLK